MAESNTFEAFREEVARLHKLLEEADSAAGCFTWHQAIHECMERIHTLYYTKRAEEDRG